MPRMIAEEAVLLVDDDPDIRETLSELLDANGYEVLQAENGQIALEGSDEYLRKPVEIERLMEIIDHYR